MPNTVNDRIRVIYKNECGSISLLSEYTGVPLGTLKNILSRGIAPSFDTLNTIANKFPQYSMDWLLTGKGEMYKTDTLDNEPTNQLENQTENQGASKTVTERLSCVIEGLNQSVGSFSNKLGVARSTVATALKRNKGVNSELLEKICVVFPMVNIEYLLTGQGEMLKSNEKAETPITSDNEVINLLKSQIEKQDVEIKRLRTEKEKMHNELGYLKGLLEGRISADKKQIR